MVAGGLGHCFGKQPGIRWSLEGLEGQRGPEDLGQGGAPRMAGCLATGRPVRGWDCAEHGGAEHRARSTGGSWGPRAGAGPAGNLGPRMAGAPRRPQASRRPKAPDVRPCRVARVLQDRSLISSLVHSSPPPPVRFPGRRQRPGTRKRFIPTTVLRGRYSQAVTAHMQKPRPAGPAPLRPGCWIRLEDASADPGGTSKRVMTFKSQDRSSASLRAKLLPR